MRRDLVQAAALHHLHGDVALLRHGDDFLGGAAQIALGHQQLFNIAAALDGFTDGIAAGKQVFGREALFRFRPELWLRRGFGRRAVKAFGAFRLGRGFFEVVFPGAVKGLVLLEIPALGGVEVIAGLAGTLPVVEPVLIVFTALLVRLDGGLAVAGSFLFPFGVGTQMVGAGHFLFGEILIKGHDDSPCDR